MRISNIQTDCIYKKEYKKPELVNFKAQNSMLLSGGMNIINKSGMNFIEKFKQILKKEKHPLDNDNTDIIEKLYQVCLNLNGTLNKDAVNAVLIMVGSKTNDFIENIKLFFKKEHYPNLFKTQGLQGISDAIKACRDNKNRINSKNLKYLIDFDNQGNNTSYTEHLHLLKNNKGVVDDDKIKFYNYLKIIGIPQYLGYFLDANRDLSKSAEKLSQNQTIQKLLNSNKNTYENYTRFIEYALQDKSDNRDKILELLDKNIKLFVSNKVKFCNDLFCDKKEQVDIDNIQIVAHQLRKNNKIIFTSPHKSIIGLIKDKEGKIKEENIRKCNFILKKYQLKELADLADIFSGYIKNKDGLISPNFMRLLTQEKLHLNGFNTNKSFDDIVEKLKIKTERVENARNYNYKFNEHENIINYVVEKNNNNVDSKIYDAIETYSDINYNKKDENGLSLIYKIIKKENIQLLKIACKHMKKRSENDTIKYSTELEEAYSKIKNIEFKKEFENLLISFPEVKEAGLSGDVEHFEKVKQQIYSPLCNQVSRSMLMDTIWIMSLNPNKKIFCKYLFNNFRDKLPDYAEFNIKEIFGQL